MTWGKLLAGLILILGLAGGTNYWLEGECLVPRTRALASAESRLAALKALSPAEVASLTNQAARLTKQNAALEKTLADAGIAELPKGEDKVIIVQQHVFDALVAHHLRVVSSSVATRREPNAAAPTRLVDVPAKPSTPARTLTAAEYEAEASKAAQKLDPKMRDAFLRGLKAKVAKMKAAEATHRDVPQPVVAHASAAPRPATPAAPFKTVRIAYVVTGFFRDVFLFFVDETKQKLGYDFADIAVHPSATDANRVQLTFTLGVNYR